MPASHLPIFTLGHEGRTVDDLITELLNNQIAFLIDVRERPNGIAALQAALLAAGVRYVDMSAAFSAQAGAAPFEEALGRLERAWQQQHRVALLGQAADPAACRRSTRIGAQLQAQGIPVMHIDARGALIAQSTLVTPVLDPDPDMPIEPDWLNDMVWDDVQPYEEPESGDFHQIGVIAPLTDTRARPGETARAVLKRVFGFDEFRPLQGQIINQVLAGKDALVIMPTGGGKSLCYQLPALMRDGLTLVVSPLISLMQNQVDQLRDWGIAAHYLNSSLAREEADAIAAQVRNGQVRLLYVAPETLLRPDTLALLRAVKVDLLAIDEAHCISQWGHDFRPEYRRLVEVRQQLPETVCIALTATAPPRVRDDIRDSLRLGDEQTFVSSFDRPNLFIGIETKRDVVQQTRNFIAERPNQSGIVYCSTIKQVELLAGSLRAAGLDVLPYHGKMDSGTRRRNQNAFVRDDVAVIIATIAFGMGIDKPNVRWILHVDLPQGMEQYYQQIGRAGRDGLRSECRLLYSYGDVRTNQFLIGSGAESERKGREIRLQAMIDWVKSSQCRRRPLLAYFGETMTQVNCGMCDNCTADQTTQVEVDLTRQAQMFLACVYRTGQVFGASHIIDVLRGSQSRKVLDRKHHRLSTYGIGTDYSNDAWRDLAQQLVDRGLLLRDMQYGSLTLTADGTAVLKGQATFAGRAAPTPVYGGAGGVSEQYDGALFEQLRALRKQLADERNVPPYVIFADRTLQEMATWFPQSENALGTIHGVGASKLAQYADRFLPVIRTYCAANGLKERARPGGSVSERRTEPISGRAQTAVDAIANGWSVAELAKEMGVKPGTVLNYLNDFVRAGGSVPEDALTAAVALDPARHGEVLDAYAETGDQYLRPIFDQFNGEVGYDDLKALRIIYWLRQRT